MEKTKEFKMVNKTIVTSKEYLSLNKLIFKIKYIPLCFGYLLAALLIIVYAFSLSYYLLGGLLLGIALVSSFGIWLIFNNSNKKIVKKFFENNEEMIFNYTFKDNYVTINFVQGLTNNTANLDYSKIYQVIVTEEFIVILISNSQGYFVAKDGFDNFDYLAFESMLKPNVKKYKVVKKK